MNGLLGNTDMPHSAAAFQQPAVDEPTNRFLAQVQQLARLVDGVEQHTVCTQFLRFVDDFFLHVRCLKKRTYRSRIWLEASSTDHTIE